MGTLRELQSKERNVHMLITNSNLVEIFVYDELKKACKANLDCIYEINTRTEFKCMLELVNIQCYLSDRWLFLIDFSKLKSLVKQFKGIFESDTSCFLIKVKNYKDYKEFKEIYSTVNDLYLSYIRSNEVSYLLTGFKLSQSVVDFVAKSYARDPEKVFVLRKALLEGIEIKTQKDVVAICGVSTGSINHFAMLLLAKPPRTVRGENMVYRKRIKMANELIEAYGISSFKNFLTATIKDMLYIKQLYMVGVVYNSIRELPEVFDEKRLSKYGMYLNTISKEIPYSRIARLYVLLKQSGSWYHTEDMLDFMYKYYGGVE